MRKKVILWIIGILFLSNTNQTKAADVDIYLNIVNSFSWSVNITWSNIFIKNNIIYTNETTAIIEIFSDVASNYTITWDINPLLSWSESNYKQIFL